MINPAEWSAASMSLIVGGLACLGSLPFGLAFGWLFARKRFPGKLLLEIAVFLPLVLPPVVTGCLIILLFGRKGIIWSPIFDRFDIDIIFTTKGMILAGAVVGFPLMVRSIRAAVEAVDPKLEQAARSLGCSPARTFWKVTLPLAWPGLLAGSLLAFTRALGEFGATRMVALNTDGTRTIALEVFQRVETPGGSGVAILRLAIISTILSGAALLVCELLARRWRTASP